LVHDCFAAHTDTVHRAHQDGELSLENEHHHCSFLGDALAPFYNDSSFPEIPLLCSAYRSFHTALVAFLAEGALPYGMPRAPPVFA
jgi:hypothetical protein